MTIHKEGYFTILLFALLCGLGIWSSVSYLGLLGKFIAVLLIGIFLFVVSFFRNPDRKLKKPDSKIVYAPADGKIVVIEKTMENEYFEEERMQISIFMSPANVHVNRNPISGVVKYNKYHPGKYLVAWHPKSSSENERNTVVIENSNGSILIRQIAGALARRIVNYLQVGDSVTQGEELGFIKFGSRVDLLLPLNAEIMVHLNQNVKGNKDIIARLA